MTNKYICVKDPVIYFILFKDSLEKKEFIFMFSLRKFKVGIVSMYKDNFYFVLRQR